MFKNQKVPQVMCFSEEGIKQVKLLMRGSEHQLPHYISKTECGMTKTNCSHKLSTGGKPVRNCIKLSAQQIYFYQVNDSN